jgi:23S rRNA (cytosine1962-C5)-methyltransferase
LTENLLEAALARRKDLLSSLHAEGTDCYRLFHGIAEGRPGVALDRYGPLLLFQTWREPLSESEIEAWQRIAERALGVSLQPVWHHRNAKDHLPVSRYHLPPLPYPPIGRELSILYDVRQRRRGQDPLLFLDLRAGRRRILSTAGGKSVLNLFAYTCGIGLAAAAAGAGEIWNVDFSRSALEVGRRNLTLNGMPSEKTRMLQEDVLPVVRQLASLPVSPRRGERTRKFTPVPARCFDIVVLDPPRWSRGPFGAVDVVRDYPSLFKPALLATAPGGRILATNQAPEVSPDDWLRVLRRTGEKCGRLLRGIELIAPEEDFPSLDGLPPLKIAWIEV